MISWHKSGDHIT